LQAGLAGSFSANLELGEVVLVKRDTIADAMVKENGNFRSVFEMGLTKKDKYPFKNGWLVNPLIQIPKLDFKKVTAISVNEITTGNAKINYYCKTYQPHIESMEGAALHYVCNMEHLPYLQLRSISNKVGIRDKKKWRIKEAVDQLNEGLKDCITLLHKEI
jgi:futalosine hydrolase